MPSLKKFFLLYCNSDRYHNEDEDGKMGPVQSLNPLPPDPQHPSLLRLPEDSSSDNNNISQPVETPSIAYAGLVPELLSPDAYTGIPFSVHRAYQVPLPELVDSALNLLPVSVPFMFRFLDCQRFTKDKTMVIYETPNIPAISYVTVSYPWIGAREPNRKPFRHEPFTIYSSDGNAYGDPICLSVMDGLCSFALKNGAEFLWVDRLCISQEDDKDVQWHFERMHDIFQSCHTCVVLPGGLQYSDWYLEGTRWASRSWAVLEALAAPIVQASSGGTHTNDLPFFDKYYLPKLNSQGDMQQYKRYNSLISAAISFRENQSTDKDKYYYYVSLWKCVLQGETSKVDSLLLFVINLMNSSQVISPSDVVIDRFKGEVSDPHSRNLCALSFRDAAFFLGPAITSQWKEFITATMLLPLRTTDCTINFPQISQPCVILDAKTGFPINQAYGIALSELEKTTHDMSSIAVPRTFRLLDCKKYVEEYTLVIYETSEIPNIPYATLSYPWVGVPCHYFAPANHTFTVTQNAGTIGDAISIDMIRLACLLALEEKADFLWVDRLCIRQMDSMDKAWQISRMCDVYNHCAVCVILPGGLQRLASLDEEAFWITRMWTLQEALVPPNSLVLYPLEQDPGSNSVQATVPLPSGAKLLPSTPDIYYSPLKDLLPLYTTRDDTMGIRLFFHTSFEYAYLLRQALSFKRLGVAAYEESYRRYFATWRSAITRSSEHPQDLLLSTMGIFNISLEEGEQRSRTNILSAFVREFRKKGIADSRVIAFRDAVLHARDSASPQWKELIEEFERSLPLLENGIAPNSNNELPMDSVGPPLLRGGSGHQIFLGSAMLVGEEIHSLHPCRIIVSSNTSFSCYVPFNHRDGEHSGRWALLPFNPDQMEWVSASSGDIPVGKLPVDGGYEKDSEHSRQCTLHFAQISVEDKIFLGKTGPHLHGCCYGSEGKEHHVKDNYQILCWKNRQPHAKDPPRYGTSREFSMPSFANFGQHRPSRDGRSRPSTDPPPR